MKKTLLRLSAFVMLIALCTVHDVMAQSQLVGNSDGVFCRVTIDEQKQIDNKLTVKLKANWINSKLETIEMDKNHYVILTQKDILIEMSEFVACPVFESTEYIYFNGTYTLTFIADESILPSNISVRYKFRIASKKEVEANLVHSNMNSNILGITEPDVMLASYPLNQPERLYAQYRGGTNPLKGLGVEQAKNELTLGKYYALIIGIDNYSGEWHKLRNATNDAKSVEILLKEKYKFEVFKTLYNNEASRKQIISELEWLINTVGENDNVFLYFSGHGEYKESMNKGYWVPADAKTKSTAYLISNSEIQTFLSGIKSKHTLLVSDACFSGDIFRGNVLTIPYESNSKYYHKVHGLPSRKAITSGGIEPVADGGTNGHSVFTYYLLKALKENEKQYFDASELFNRIKIPIVNNSEQTPVFMPIKDTGDEGGQFIFINND